MADPGAADAALLDKRMESLRLARTTVEKNGPAIMLDLQRVCSSCSLKSRCARDLASEESAAAVAEYCPNEQTLKALREA